MSNFREFVNVKVQKKSGFDKSFKNLLTSKVGTLTPILTDELIPNTTVHLNTAIKACLPPLASDTFMNCDLCVEAFFVPSRILYQGFDKWVTGDKIWNYGATGMVEVHQPVLRATAKQLADYASPGSLADYLGVKLTRADSSAMASDTSTSHTIDLNIFPFLAYHKIWDDWYRNSQVQSTIFREQPVDNVGALPYRTFNYIYTVDGSNWTYPDNKTIWSLRQRNFGSDYFSTATPNPQQGAAQSVRINTTMDTSTSGHGDMTIASLRAANSLQMFMERNNMGGFRYVDWLKVNYGADLSDGVAQRPLYLGSTRINVYSKGINATAESGLVSSQNPFTTVGAQYGQAVVEGQGSLIKNFTCAEHGYLMVLASLVPKVTYGSGISRYLTHYTVQGSQTDMANALLQNTGNQPIYTGELMAYDGVYQSTQVFGYTDRYAEFMTREDELHGLVRDGYSLAAFAAQRNFEPGRASINSSFLEIPTTYLDQVSAVDSDISSYGCWMDCYFDYKVSQPLARYSIPSLQDPAAEHGVSISVKRNGNRID